MIKKKKKKELGQSRWLKATRSKRTFRNAWWPAIKMMQNYPQTRRENATIRRMTAVWKTGVSRHHRDQIEGPAEKSSNIPALSCWGIMGGRDPQFMIPRDESYEWETKASRTAVHLIVFLQFCTPSWPLWTDNDSVMSNRIVNGWQGICRNGTCSFLQDDARYCIWTLQIASGSVCNKKDTYTFKTNSQISFTW